VFMILGYIMAMVMATMGFSMAGAAMGALSAPK